MKGFKKQFVSIVSAAALAVSAASHHGLAHAQEGSAAKPLRVVLIPADGGTEDGTKKDFLPVFNAVSQAR